MCPTKDELVEEVRWGGYFLAENGYGHTTLWVDNPEFPEYPVAISHDEDVVRFARRVMNDAGFWTSLAVEVVMGE